MSYLAKSSTKCCRRDKTRSFLAIQELCDLQGNNREAGMIPPGEEKASM